MRRDQSPETIFEPNSNIIVNLHPTDGTHCVLVIRREGGPTSYFHSFGVEIPPLFLEEYIDLGSNERIPQYDESYCGAYCLYMIYLIDRGFSINNALNILVNQCKYPGIYSVCFCLGCNVNYKYNDNDNVNVIDTDKNNDNDNYNDNDNVSDNDNDNDNVNDKDKVDDNDLRSNFTNNDNDNDNANDNVNDNDNHNDNVNDIDNFIYLFDEKHQRGKPNNKEYPRTDSVCGKQSSYTDPSNNIAVKIKEDLQSWLDDENIITEATLLENFRCIISDPSECGKTFLLKKTHSG